MVEVAVSQLDLLCKNCAGQCAYDPASQELLCQSCGTQRAIVEDTSGDPTQEFPFDPDTPLDEPKDTLADRAFRCQTCGGEVIFSGASLSSQCPYCDGPVVMAQLDEAFETMALIPFRITKDAAAEAVKKWVGRRLAAPGDLPEKVAEGRMAGLYAPFWTFDSQEAIQYWATYKTGSGDNRRTHRTSGQFKTYFDDLLVPASTHVTPLIRDGILHDFRPDRLRNYTPGYLAGFAAERHHMTVKQGLAVNAGDKDLLIRNRIKDHVGRSGTKVSRYLTDTSGIHYRRILLPVWIVHYTYGDDAKKVVVSGIDGRTFGERPFSRWKLAAYSAAITAATMAFGILWGMGAAP